MQLSKANLSLVNNYDYDNVNESIMQLKIDPVNHSVTSVSNDAIYESYLHFDININNDEPIWFKFSDLKPLSKGMKNTDALYISEKNSEGIHAVLNGATKEKNYIEPVVPYWPDLQPTKSLIRNEDPEFSISIKNLEKLVKIAKAHKADSVNVKGNDTLVRFTSNNNEITAWIACMLKL